jgi:hypothetical protein
VAVGDEVAKAGAQPKAEERPQRAEADAKRKVEEQPGEAIRIAEEQECKEREAAESATGQGTEISVP